MRPVILGRFGRTAQSSITQRFNIGNEQDTKPVLVTLERSCIVHMETEKCPQVYGLVKVKVKLSS
jgi:hypothetical protein